MKKVLTSLLNSVMIVTNVSRRSESLRSRKNRLFGSKETAFGDSNSEEFLSAVRDPVAVLLTDSEVVIDSRNELKN